jgi:hypothetical protein
MADHKPTKDDRAADDHHAELRRRGFVDLRGEPPREKRAIPEPLPADLTATGARSDEKPKGT